MHTLGQYYGAQRTLEGELVIMFSVDGDGEFLQRLDEDKGKRLVIDTKIFREKRSLNANAYFWKLCDEIGKVLGCDKDVVYLMMLSRYGVFDDMEVVKGAVEHIKKLYRVVNETDEYEVLDSDTMETRHIVSLRCYEGSSTYDTAQMARLINGTLNEAHDLGIDTWSDEEVEYLISQWRKRDETHKRIAGPG